MAKAAFATWNNRIAPVFDVPRPIRIVETHASKINSQTETTLADGHQGSLRPD